MEYTKDQLLACLLYEFKCADDLDLEIIEEILARRGAIMTDSEEKIYERLNGVRRHVVITADKKKDGAVRCIYSLPQDKIAIATVAENGIVFLSETIDNRLYDAIKSIKINPSEWLLRRLIKDPNRDSLTNETLRKEINPLKSRGYIQATRIKLTEKGEQKTRDPERREELERIIEKFNLSTDKCKYSGNIIGYLEHGTVMGSAFEVTVSGKFKIREMINEESAPDYLKHGAKKRHEPGK